VGVLGFRTPFIVLSTTIFLRVYDMLVYVAFLGYSATEGSAIMFCHLSSRRITSFQPHELSALAVKTLSHSSHIRLQQLVSDFKSFFLRRY